MSDKSNLTQKIRRIKQYKLVCPTRDCYRKATEKVSIDVPRFGVLDLKVCKICIRRLGHKNTDINRKNHFSTTTLEQEIQNKLDSMRSMMDGVAADLPRGMFRL